MIEIYLAITQKQLTNFESLISVSETIHKSNMHKLLIRDASFTYTHELWDEVITSNVLFQYKSNSKLTNFFYMFKKIKAYKNIILQLEKFKNSKDVRIFICYIEDVLSNFLFFYFNNNAEFIVVEDGVLNYYKHTLNNVNQHRFFLKKTISLFYGIPFKAYTGHSSGAEYERVKEQFLTFPESAFISKKTHQLPVKKKFMIESTKSLFLIGQETYIELLGKDVYRCKFRTFLISIHAEVKKQGISKVYYKPRYKITEFEQKILSQVFGKKNITIVNSQLSSEEVFFQNLKSSHVASFDSSTSINIYAQLHDNQRVCITFYYYPVYQSKVCSLFNSLGFNKLN